MSLSKLQTRLVSALIMFPPVILIVYVGGAFFAALLFLTFLISLHEWSRLSFKTNFSFVFLILGLFYLGGSYYAFYQLREIPETGLILSILAFFSVWSSDSFAYIFGKVIGGPKLLPMVSPNKTVAGLLGAMFGVITVLLIGKIALEVLDISEPYMSYIFILLFGAFLGIVAQAGDLMISALKRIANVKDTGTIIPGHGGLLDRIDALLLVTPVFYFVAAIFLNGS